MKSTLTLNQTNRKELLLELQRILVPYADTVRVVYRTDLLSIHIRPELGGEFILPPGTPTFEEVKL